MQSKPLRRRPSESAARARGPAGRCSPSRASNPAAIARPSPARRRVVRDHRCVRRRAGRSLVAAAGAAGVQAVLEMTDYAPLPLREPVRSLVWIRGRLQNVPACEVSGLLDLIATEDPNPALLQVNSGPSHGDGDARYALMRLEIDSVVVADSTGAESIGVSTLLGARPDPFCAMESCWLQHMESAHREVVDRLATRLPMALRRGRVRPLGLDRYGVQLRVEGDDGDHDVRLPFTKPVDDITGLSQAIRVLMGCPFLNGLRARRV